MTGWVIRRATRLRPVTLHAYREADLPRDETVFDCTACDARSSNYNMSDVTGLDFQVLQCLIGQSTIAQLVHDAVLRIETFDLRRVSFTCHGGTHRSVGVCYLVNLLAYPDATVHPHTRRTKQRINGSG